MMRDAGISDIKLQIKAVENVVDLSFRRGFYFSGTDDAQPPSTFC